MESQLILTDDFGEHQATKLEASQNSPVKHQTTLASTLSSDVYKVLGLIEYGSIEYAREIALNPNFMTSNKEFLQMGKCVKKCLCKGYISFAQELFNSGYSISDSILIKAIERKNSNLINMVISSKLYNKSMIELEYWYLLYNDYIQFAEMLKGNEEILEKFSKFQEEIDCEESLVVIALDRALQRNYTDVACIILMNNPTVLTASIIETAINNKNLEFLRRLWCGDLNPIHKHSRTKRKSLNPTWKSLNQNLCMEDKVKAKKMLKISHILEVLLGEKLIEEARKIITWPDAVDDPEILKVCINLKFEELAREIIKLRKKNPTVDDFELSFSCKFFGLCTDMLNWKEVKIYLYKQEVQLKLLDLISKGKYCFYAAEMICAIDPKYWVAKNTSILCKKIIFQVSKTSEILKCHFSLLYIVLLCEYLSRILKVYPIYRGICQETIKRLIFLGKCIEDAITEESELKAFLMDCDRKGRSVLSIISSNGFYTLLENNDVGSIISNLWIGNRKHDGIMKASTLYTSYFAPDESDEKLIFLNSNDSNKNYMFQYDQLENSCELRFYGQIVSNVLLVYFFTMIIYTATKFGSMNDPQNNPTSNGFLMLSQLWIFGVFIEKILAIVFCVATRRDIVLDFWFLVDFFIIILTILQMSNVNNKIAGSNNLISFVSYEDYNILNYGFILCLIWLRFFSVLLTTYTYGPLLHILYMMGQAFLDFFSFFFSMLFIGSSILFLLFNQKTSTNKFDSFGISFQTAFRNTLGDFDLTDFTSYESFGSISQGIYIVLTNIIMLNILIATLAFVYDKEKSTKIAKFRANLVYCYEKWKWNQQYGLLILLPSPISLVVFCVFPLLFVGKYPERTSSAFSKCFFVLFAIPMFIYFSVYSVCFVPLIYFTSLGNFAKAGAKKTKKIALLEKIETESDSDEEDEKNITKAKVFSKRRALVWIIIGLFIVLIAYFRDLYDFWKIMYRKNKKNERIGEKKYEDKGKKSKLNSEVITAMQTVLKSFEKNDIFYEEFIEKYKQIENLNLSSILKSNKTLFQEHTQIIENYLENWLFSKKSLIIRKDIIKALLPVQNYYSNDYVKRANHMKIHQIKKASKVFKKYFGKIKIHDIKIPKYVVNCQEFQISQILRTTKNIALVNLDVNKMIKAIDKIVS